MNAYGKNQCCSIVVVYIMLERNRLNLESNKGNYAYTLRYVDSLFSFTHFCSFENLNG